MVVYDSGYQIEKAEGAKWVVAGEAADEHVDEKFDTWTFYDDYYNLEMIY